MFTVGNEIPFYGFIFWMHNPYTLIHFSSHIYRINLIDSNLVKMNNWNLGAVLIVICTANWNWKFQITNKIFPNIYCETTNFWAVMLPFHNYLEAVVFFNFYFTTFSYLSSHYKSKDIKFLISQGFSWEFGWIIELNFGHWQMFISFNFCVLFEPKKLHFSASL